MPVPENIAQFRPPQHDTPAQLQPHQQQRQSGQRTVYGTVRTHADLETDVKPLNDLVNRPGNHRRHESVLELHRGRRHKHVEEDKQHPHQHIRQQLDHNLEKRTDQREIFLPTGTCHEQIQTTHENHQNRGDKDNREIIREHPP